jgi:hypothetical protein
MKIQWDFSGFDVDDGVWGDQHLWSEERADIEVNRVDLLAVKL